MLNQTHTVTTIILAGGEGRRMDGKDKGLLLFKASKFDKELPLIEHVIKRLIPQSAQILISANRNKAQYQDILGRYQQNKQIVFADKDDLKALGPMAGMLSAVDYLDLNLDIDTDINVDIDYVDNQHDFMRERIQFVSCDAPFIPLDLIEKLYSKTAASYPVTLEKQHYCHTQLFKKDLTLIKARLEHKELKIRSFLAFIKAQAVVFDDEASFFNCNTKQELYTTH
ncbi:molybdenum cofactor guanylyltransferase [Gammaproteobacteria bacterium]|nr:molybdenum cofactor guanylyltransferase [Gammaproteobacteria bacterium]